MSKAFIFSMFFNHLVFFTPLLIIAKTLISCPKDFSLRRALFLFEERYYIIKALNINNINHLHELAHRAYIFIC